ncbi:MULTISPECIES: LacI family DNA-binding transcriptional regulator [Paenibacillus]|uniref:LacI family transcriptional regulator n=4 Tax=Paenibacillus TaxID=44249 RepID=A0A1R1F2D8_9BACL|nr:MULTISPECIES: LacI family DNA-binding transcriptional regulator [Paenibacillus]MBJ9990524.1 LacI family DNA-binding transcriptional regulator [Paenibacillus sp. S28]MEC0173584.1 LacI family DNA-binding transcriptional regulator [Paenibacillus favisporus]OMF58191.1 LacI family transcriptional regulator [Paenibacillus rhizosphaerae]OXL83070.1 LacI family transcriptional regulator [Paenibacillus sp. SSG-1]RED41128.1 LacI family transcriptional regulator [Paenibacillus sp. VMFN-D1]
MSNKKKVTIEDVAKQAGVGIATVSRALNNSGGISEKTKARIMQVIDEMGFVPNTSAQSLKIRQTHQIALAVPDIRNAIIPDIAWSVEQAAKQHGYRVVQINTLGNARLELETLREIKKLHVDGLVLMPLAYPKQLESLINQASIPVSVINYGKKLSPDLKADIVGLARQEGRLVMEHLLQIGRARIAYAGAPKDKIEERYLAYEQSLRHVDASLVYFGEDFSFETGRQAADYFYSLKHMPDAIYAVNDMVAIGIVNRFKELGIRVPQDVAVVGIDNNLWATVTTPQISSVSIMGSEVGRLAAELLLKRIQSHNPPDYERVEFEPRLIVRESSVSMTQYSNK